MSNRDGKEANRKKRDKYKVGSLCPKCGKGHLVQLYKAKNHVGCPICKDKNY